jgi:CDGSH-type Zn-finger protein
MDEPEVVITSYRDGPLLVRGPFRLQDQEGNEIEVGRRTVALCRCGKSRIRPFCDGTHAMIRFRAPSEAERGRAPGAAARRFDRPVDRPGSPNVEERGP